MTGDSEAAAKVDALHAALLSGDAMALEAAGVSPDIARELALGRALARVAARIRDAERSEPTDGRWWRRSTYSPEDRELQLRNRREISDALAAAFGDDLGLFSRANSFNLAFLAPEKRDALRRITQDYDEMMAKFSEGGIQLASDRERLELLRAERDRDIAALLTPAEREAYEMRTSRTAANVRARYGDGIQTEEDYRKIYALQKAFDDKFQMDGSGGRLAPEAMSERLEAQRQLQDDIRASLGDERYTELRRATDSDLRAVDSLVSRLNLPPDATDRVALTRDTLAAESQRINTDASLSPVERREQLEALGARAKTELVQALGSEAADAYAQRSPWISMLQGGLAYSTSPRPNAPAGMFGGNPGVYPVPPARVPGSAGGSQAVIMRTPMHIPMAADGVPGDIIAGPAPGRVMVYSSTAPDASPVVSDPTAGGARRQGLVVPGDSAKPEAQPKR